MGVVISCFLRRETSDFLRALILLRRVYLGEEWLKKAEKRQTCTRCLSPSPSHIPCSVTARSLRKPCNVRLMSRVGDMLVHVMKNRCGTKTRNFETRHEIVHDLEPASMIMSVHLSFS